MEDGRVRPAAGRQASEQVRFQDRLELRREAVRQVRQDEREVRSTSSAVPSREQMLCGPGTRQGQRSMVMLPRRRGLVTTVE